MRALPWDRLEKLKGVRKGQFSMSINDEWRICIKWQEGNTRIPMYQPIELVRLYTENERSQRIQHYVLVNILE
ncbi:MAG: type II toxin-antitoxin system RelE/ParE family toxin [Spirochaetales bacterium]|nr:type II toxin-antitoxin system RelE/ParE family toxin [Spirochaetales bacterium]